MVAIKRLWLGLYLGKKTFANYAEDLTKVVKKAVILSDVAALARLFLIESLDTDGSAYSSRAPSISRFGMSREEVRRIRCFVPVAGFGTWNRTTNTDHFLIDASLLQFDVMVRSSAQAPYEEDESFSFRDEKDVSYHGGRLVDPDDFDQDGDLSNSQRMKIDELLGAWYVRLVSTISPYR